jgi:tetratricopeptide (TPR) repeat protein
MAVTPERGVSFAYERDSLNMDTRLDRIENSLTEVRRDQLNYKLEKDLLKEAFSSNYQTVNIVLAIVLGVFSVIGFLGIRDIGAIKKEYLAELERVNSLRNDLEVKVKQIGEQQERVQNDYLEIVKTNEEQSRRIKVLELQEKISSLMQTNNFQRALEYVTVALDLDRDNTILLEQKATSLWKLNDFEGAMDTYT